MSAPVRPDWPVVKSYDHAHLRRIALPLGGIGTGTISLGGRGDLRDWEVMNTPAKGFTPGNAFFALSVKTADGPRVTRALEGMIDPADYDGGFGCTVPNHGLPRFRDCAFHAAYPLAQVTLSDPEAPVAVRLEAFNPLIPGDADASGIPVAVLRYVIINPTDAPVQAAVCGTVPNFIGAGGVKVNRYRAAGALHGLLLATQDGQSAAEDYGTLALSVLADDATYRTAWGRQSWNAGLLDFWDDFSADGRLQELPEEQREEPNASLATAVEVPPRGERAITFLITWHFPNRMTWTPREVNQGGACACGGTCGEQGNPNYVGNYYALQYADAWDIALQTAAALPALEARTLTFVRAFCESDLPPVVKEAALFNISTLRSQTCFRTADGRFYGWEGCGDKSGCCHGSCTHVWNYEQATAFLFGDLSRAMREVEFLQATRDDGLMPFRINLPIDRAAEYPYAAADGQLGCLMKLYRDWQLSGDDDLLRALWPKARKALEFCWIPNGWDDDRDGVMEGCQHNTMDVEYYGPNGQMGGWYLGALRATEEMAAYLGETDFAATCRDLYRRGRAWMDAHLFNGEYYEHEIRPPLREENIAPGLRSTMGTANFTDPDFQLGPCCLVDQLVGQYMAHVCGLGYLLDAEHVNTTLRSIMRYNFRRLTGHFNNMRTFALQEESALLMGAYPHGNRPQAPFPYSTEVMTGFEYTAAVHLLYEGQVEDGLRVIAAIRDRYDGWKRNPFDEAECGHHYGRAMASWAAVLALTGFHYSAVTGAMTFAAKDGTHFWSNGHAWGTCEQATQANGVHITLRVLHGSLRLQTLTLDGTGSVTFGALQEIPAGASLEIDMVAAAR